jgi:hypothetical protein
MSAVIHIASPPDIKAVALRMSRVYAGNTSWHYRADFKNVTFERENKRVPKYEDVEGAPTLAEFEDHLLGVKGLLVIPITKSGACRFGKIDVDIYGPDRETRGKEMCRKIARLGLPLIPEYSKSDGMHLAHYSASNVSATDMREKLCEWIADLDLDPKTEIFPKQDKLSDGDPGSGINLPYFDALGKGSKNYAVNRDGEPLSIEEWLTMAESLPANETYVPGVVNVEGASALLSAHWTAGQRDTLNLAVAGTLLRRGLNSAVIQEIICGATDLMAGDLTSKQVETIERDLAANKRVPGYPALEALIGKDDIRELMRLTGAAEYKDPEEPFSTDLVMTAGQFLKLDLPKRDPIVDEFLYAQSLNEVVGYRGVGKTWFVLMLLKAIAEGSPFLSWTVPKRRRVLYVDGEMAANQLQERMRDLFGNSVPEYFELMASEIFYKETDSSLIINHTAQQKRFDGLLVDLAALDRNPEVIVFDNLSALTSGIEENSSSEFQILKAWFTKLRHMGYSVIFVHHSGKDGKQRGTSAREDNLDMTIELLELPAND